MVASRHLHGLRECHQGPGAASTQAHAAAGSGDVSRISLRVRAMMPISHLREPVSLWHALRALSVALDLAMGRRPGHAQATATLSLKVGQHLGLEAADLEGLVLAALLKDAGCPATRATFTQLVGVD